MKGRMSKLLWARRRRVRKNLSDVQERAAKAALYPARRHWRHRV